MNPTNWFVLTLLNPNTWAILLLNVKIGWIPPKLVHINVNKPVATLLASGQLIV